MGQQQETIEDRLVNVIQRLQLQRETGQLTAKHGHGIAAEEGIIVFSNGKVTEARVGRRTGSEALNRLSKWENCLCWFVSSVDNGASSRPFTSLNGSSGVPPSNPFTPIPFSPLRTGVPEENTRVSEMGISSNPLVPQLVTQRQWCLKRIERLGLSRTHRRLFLLIDGQRTIPELMRLIGKGEGEVYMLLQDLEHAAVIRIYHEV